MDQTLQFDGMVELGTREKVESYTSEILCRGLDDILRLYNRSHIYIIMICDNEFKRIFQQSDTNWDIEFNYNLPQ